MDTPSVGLIGGIVGAVIGTCGGIIGTYFSLKGVRGPRERAFMIRASAAIWLGVIAFLAAMWLVPSPHRFLLWLPYVIVLPIGLGTMNRRLEQLRLDDRSPA